MWIIIILLLVFFTLKHMDLDDEEVGKHDLEHLRRKIKR